MHYEQELIHSDSGFVFQCGLLRYARDNEAGAQSAQTSEDYGPFQNRNNPGDERPRQQHRIDTWHHKQGRVEQ